MPANGPTNNSEESEMEERIKDYCHGQTLFYRSCFGIFATGATLSAIAAKPRLILAHTAGAIGAKALEKEKYRRCINEKIGFKP